MWGKLAAKVYRNGDWSFRRRAFDSAIIPFHDMADRLPQTDYESRALARLVEIYEILEYDDKRQEARDRLLRDYPQSAEARLLGRGGVS